MMGVKEVRHAADPFAFELEAGTTEISALQLGRTEQASDINTARLGDG